jgi:hypothetical protein
MKKYEMAEHIASMIWKRSAYNILVGKSVG